MRRHLVHWMDSPPELNYGNQDSKYVQMATFWQAKLTPSHRTTFIWQKIKSTRDGIMNMIPASFPYVHALARRHASQHSLKSSR